MNAGIVECHRNGILTATTIMANGDAFEDAVQLAKLNPTLDIGVHLVLVGGPNQPESPAGLIRQIARRQVDLYGEMRRQVETVLAAGLQPSHVDTHKHTHLLPPVLKAVIRISREFGIPWVRKPADFTMSMNATPALKRAVGTAVRFAASRFDRALKQGGCRYTDHFTGFEITGKLTTQTLIQTIQHLPAGLTELMCHPGYLSQELHAAPTRLKESRERELLALTATETRKALLETGVLLTSYRAL